MDERYEISDGGGLIRKFKVTVSSPLEVFIRVRRPTQLSVFGNQSATGGSSGNSRVFTAVAPDWLPAQCGVSSEQA